MDDNGVPQDDEVIAALYSRVASFDQRKQELIEEIAEIDRQSKRYRRALQALTSEATIGRPPSKPPAKKYPKGIGDERLDAIRRVVFELAAEKDEFSQVDVRGRRDINSSLAATAFEKLRQEGMIRVARKEGNNKYYRLTQSVISQPGRVEMDKP